MIKWTRQIRKHYKEWLLIFLAVIGLGSGLFAIFPVHPTLWTGAVILFVCIVITTIITTIYNRENYLPETAFLMLEESPRARISFSFENDFIKAANMLAHDHYGSNTISLESVRLLNEKNRFMTSFISDKNNKFMGYFDILPLNESFASDFLAGIKTESDIGVDDILEPEKMINSSFLYFSGISVKHVDSALGSRFGSYLLYAAINYLALFYRDRLPVNVYALSATSNGRKILERLNFEVIVDESNRKDGMDLYFRAFTNEQLSALLKRHSYCEDYVDLSSYHLHAKSLPPKFQPGHIS